MTMIRSTVRSALALAILLLLPTLAKAQSVVYSGDAAAARADVLGVINLAISDTGPLPSTGGSLSTTLLQFNLPPTLDLNLLSAAVNGSNNQTNANASVANVSVNVAGIHITASVLTSNATATCSATTASTSGSSNILDLKVNGLRVDVSAQPNFTVPLLVGSLVLNEQISSVVISSTVNSANMTVNALHLRVLGVADVAISSSNAGVSCPAGGGVSPE